MFRLKDLGYFNSDDAHELEAALTSWQSKKASWFEYEMKVVGTFEKYLSQIEPEKMQEVAKIIVAESGHKIYHYTLNLLQKLQKDGYYTLAISASQQEIAEEFAKKYKFDDCLGAAFDVKNGHYHKPSRVIFGRKHEIIKEYINDHPTLTLKDSVAVGDSGGDISMLELVENPIAFNPSGELLDLALKNGWKVVIERKNIAYTLQKQGDQTILAQTEAF